MSPVLTKWPYVGGVLWNPEAQSPLTIMARCLRGVLCVDCMCFLSWQDMTVMCVLVGEVIVLSAVRPS